MDFTFSPEQQQLRDSVRGFLADKAPSSYVRSMIEDERGFSDEVWNQVVDLGWTSILVPEDAGGLGMSTPLEEQNVCGSRETETMSAWRERAQNSPASCQCTGSSTRRRS